MRGRRVYTFGDISGVDPINDRIPILDMSQSGEARDKLVSPASLLSGVSIDTSGFVTTGQTGDFYPRSNPSGFITGQDLSSYATTIYVTGISGNLQGQINELNLVTGDFLLSSESGLFYPTNNPSGFISGVDFSPYATIVFTTGISGYLQTEIDTLNSLTGNFVLESETGQFYSSSNPSGYITGQDLSNYSTIPYVTGISGNLQGQITNLNNATGNYYLNSNPSGFITGDLSDYSTLAYTNSVSGALQSGINSISSGPIVQMVRAVYTGTAVGTTIADLRYVTAAPLMTLGDQYMTIAITPISSTNRIRVCAFGAWSHSSSTNMSLLLGRSGDSNARSIQTTIPNTVRSDYVTRITHQFDEVAGGTGLIRYNLRAGGATAGTTSFNVAQAGSYPWGQQSFIEVEEYTP